MDRVEKKISLEDFRSRFFGNLPYINAESGNTEWGKMVKDVVITEDDELFPLKDTLPLVETFKTEDGLVVKKIGEYGSGVEPYPCFQHVLRYKTMLSNYLFLKNFVSSCVFYKIRDCGNNSRKWKALTLSNSEKFDYIDDNEVDFFEYLPELSGYSGTSVVGVNDDGIEAFEAKFRLPNDSKRYEVTYKKRCESLYKGLGEETFSEPFVDVPLMLTEEFVDEGLLTPDFEKWVAKKKYYLNEKVYNEDSIWYLSKGDAYDIMQLTGSIGLHYSGQCINFPISNPSLTANTYYKDENDNVFLCAPYYRGYYKPDEHITYFDQKDAQGNYMHWKKDVVSGLTPVNGSSITGITEGYLERITPSYYSYDDDGNILPFRLLTTSGGSEDTELYDVYLPYTTMNLTFAKIYDSIHENFYDQLSAITFYNGNVSISGKTYAEYTEERQDESFMGYTTNEKCQTLLNRFGNVPTVRTTFDLAINGGDIPEDILYLLDLETTNSAITIADKEEFNRWYVNCEVKTITTDEELENILNSGNTSMYNFLKNIADTVKFTYILDSCTYEENGQQILSKGVTHEDTFRFRVAEYACKKQQYWGYSSAKWFPYTLEGDEVVSANVGNFNFTGRDIESIYCYTGTTTGDFIFNNEQYYIRTNDIMCCRNVFEYIYIEDETVNYDQETNLDYTRSKHILSHIGYVKNADDDKRFGMITPYKNESLLGIQDIDKKGIDVNISRGRYTAFETHNILSEVNTFQDLYNYRNNFFNLTTSDTNDG